MAMLDPEECDSELLDIQDGVGIIDIKGSLVAGEAGFYVLLRRHRLR